MTAITSAAIGVPGIPSRPAFGRGTGAPSAGCSQAPAGLGCTTASPRQSPARNAATVPPLVAKLSAPASSGMPATVWRATLPPSTADASSSVTRTPPTASSRAATIPAMPPPTTTTCGGCGDPGCSGRGSDCDCDCDSASASAPSMHELHDAGEHSGVGVRRHPVPEVQHVRRGFRAAGQHLA